MYVCLWPVTNPDLGCDNDLARLGRLPTCKQHDSQVVIYHTTSTQLTYIINYIFIYSILKVYNLNNYRSSFYLTYDTTTHHTIKEITQDTLDGQYTDPPPSNDLMSK